MAPPTQDEIERKADVLARKKVTLIMYSIELTRPSPERAHLKGRKDFGQILRPSANPAVALHTRWAERQRHCSDGQRTRGFYFLLHEQGAQCFVVHTEGKHEGTLEDMMQLGDDEESRLVREAGGTFRGYSDKEPQALNFKKPGQGGVRARLLAKARAELDPTVVGYCCQEPGCEKQRVRPTMLCIGHGGGRRCQETLEDGTPCPSAAHGSTDFCVRHGGGRRCQETLENGKPCPSSAVGSTDFCVRHGGGRRCQETLEDGKPCPSSAQGSTDFCVGLCRGHIRKRKLSAAVDDAITAGAGAAAAAAAAITAAAFEEF